MQKRFHRFLAACFAVLLTLSLCPGTPAGAAVTVSTKTEISEDDQEKLDGLKSEQKELEQKIKDVKSNLSAIKNSKEKLIDYQAQLEESISLIKKRIKNLESQIAILEADIAQKGVEIDDKVGEIEGSKDLLRERLRAMQMTNTQSTLSVIMGADSFSDMMSHTKLFERISQKDRSLIDRLFSEKEAIEEIQAGIVSDNEVANAAKSELDEDRRELDAQIAESEKNLKEIKANEVYYQKLQKELEAEQKKVQKEISDIYASYVSTYVEFVGGKFAWPVPGHYTISSHFGQREINGKQDNHTGMDITGSGVRGAKIVASLDGTVMAVRSYTSGYGNHVILDHGGGYSTLYAHCQSVIVKEGDVVVQGQTIAYVGSTGWSTGPHCHFEVRISGKAVNPYSYVKG